MPPEPDHKSTMHNLGAFFGHVWRGIKTDPTRKVVSREVEEEVRETPTGRVVLRRTTVEEVEVNPRSPKAPPDEPDASRAQHS